MNLTSLFGISNESKKDNNGSDSGKDDRVKCTRNDFDTLDDYMRYLTTRPGVVLFITGTPTRPHCGFTRRLCDMLAEMRVPYVYFDIMGDAEVCEGLKRFSD
uniref:Monothiol glutaredoxin-4 n=1 Tax=Lygus hesperus TaxID=30085 RepID=A0A0A9YRH3_LYGHE